MLKRRIVHIVYVNYKSTHGIKSHVDSLLEEKETVKLTSHFSMIAYI